MSSLNESEAERVATRIVAILAKSACTTHRLAIHSHITSQGFDIIDERKEHWSFDEDLDFIHDFLHDPLSNPDAEQERDKWTKRLTQGEIYVMVLERQSAVQTWRNVCGPDIDNEDNSLLDDDGLTVKKSGLRARYGAGAIYAPSSAAMAQRQVALCFPDLATAEARAALEAEALAAPTSIAAVDSNGAFLVRQDDDIVYDEQGQAFDAHNGEPLELQQELVITNDAALSPDASQATITAAATTSAGTSQRVFKARPLPSSYKQQAATQPRLSRAAALRMGVPLPEPPKRAASTVSSENKDVNLGISGVPKASISVPKSLAAPSIAPRMNKNATARTGKGNVQLSSSASSSSVSPTRERKPVDYSNTPGHKRSSTSVVKLASLAEPSVAPRLNKAAAARVSHGTGAGVATAPTVAFGSSSSSTSPAAANRRPARPLSVASGLSGVTSSSVQSPAVRKPVDFSNTPGHKRASMSVSGSASTLKSLQAPTIAPRGNRTSMARNGTTGDVGKPAPTTASPPKKTTTAPARPASVIDRRSSSFASSMHSGGGDPTNAASNKTLRERQPVDYSNTPGHKRASSAMGGGKIASLSQPSIVPRANMASQKRMSVGGAASVLTGSLNAPSSVRTSRPPPSSFRA